MMNSSDRHRACTDIDRCKNHDSLVDSNIQGCLNPSTSMTDAVRENLGYFFCETATSLPDHVALIDLWNGDERKLTYGNLDDRANRVAGLLQSRGLQSGDRLALLVGNRSEYIEIFFGAMRAGIVPVPLNIKQTRPILEFMIEDAGCVGAVIDPDAVSDGLEIIDGLGLGLKITLGAAAAAWIAYEEALVQAPSEYTPVSALHCRFDRSAQGRSAHPRRHVMERTGDSAALADQRFRSWIGCGSAVSQERHARHHQAHSLRRCQGGHHAAVRAAELSSGRSSLPGHIYWRRAGYLRPASSASGLDQGT
jgi:non-ribosomal peptide synthetase component F